MATINNKEIQRISRRTALAMFAGVGAAILSPTEADAQRRCRGLVTISNQMYRETNGVEGYQVAQPGRPDTGDLHLGPRSGVPFIVQVEGSSSTITGVTNSSGEVESFSQGRVVSGVGIEDSCRTLSDGTQGLRFTVVNGIRGTRSVHEVRDTHKNQIQKWSQEVPGVTEAITPGPSVSPLPRRVPTTPAPSDIDVQPALIGTARATRTPGSSPAAQSSNPETLTPTATKATETPTPTQTHTLTPTQTFTPSPTSTETPTSTTTSTPTSTEVPTRTPTATNTAFETVRDEASEAADWLLSPSTLLVGALVGGTAALIYRREIVAATDPEQHALSEIKHSLATDAHLRTFYDEFHTARVEADGAITNDQKKDAADKLIAVLAAEAAIAQKRSKDARAEVLKHRARIATSPEAKNVIVAEDKYRTKIEVAKTSGSELAKIDAVEQLQIADSMHAALNPNDPLRRFDDQLSEALKVTGRKRIFPWVGRWKFTT